MKDATAYVVLVIPVERAGTTAGAAQNAADLSALSMKQSLGTVFENGYTGHGQTLARALKDLDVETMVDHHGPSAQIVVVQHPTDNP